MKRFGIIGLLFLVMILQSRSAQAAVTYIPVGAAWKYLDNGSDQGTAWRTSTFNDSSWASGSAQLGFGDGDEATVLQRNLITAYFRHSFTTAQTASELRLRVLRDDGVLLYLNGIEIYRENMPPGAVNYQTLASAVLPEENAYVEVSVSGEALLQGANVLAAEVHQVNVTSSDLGFDLELVASDGTPPAELPLVTVAAVDGEAAEQLSSSAPNPGQFRISRTGSTDAALSITVQYAGAAQNGTDYAQLPTEWVIPAGETSVALAVAVLDDEIAEDTESVVLTVLQPECALQSSPPAGCYRVGVSSTATVHILDNEEAPPTDHLIAAGSVWKYLDNGSDQGTAWRAPAFNDSSWASGPGQLGFGDGDEATVLQRGLITAYFRHTFTAAQTTRGLRLRVLRDDGVILYVNGVEIFRDNMPAAAVDYQTLASAVAGDENGYVEALVSGDALVQGVNVLAAEVHQVNVTSSDLGFDLEVRADDQTPPPELPYVGIEVSSDHISEQSPVIDPPLSEAIIRLTRTGPTDSSLAVNLRFGGNAANGIDLVQLPSSVVIPAGSSTLEFMMRPIDDAIEESTEIFIVSIEQPSCAHDPVPPAGCYRGSGGVTISILDNDAPVPPDSITLIAQHALWKYLDDGSDQGTDWRTLNFNDSAWASGLAQLGYGDGDESTMVSFGPDPTQKHITTYFRHAFQVGDPSAITHLSVRVLRDDGVVVYLNGSEIFRNNLPGGEIPFNTLASTAAEENIFLVASVPSGFLVAGHNVIAAEIHQSSPVSSDISFDLELLAQGGTPPLDLPTVSAIVVDGEAAEISPLVAAAPNSGQVRLVRTGSTEGALHVTLRYEGSAENGADYVTLPTEVEIPAGQAVIELSVDALDDELIEGTENVMVIVVQPACAHQSPPPSGCYRIGASSAATVHIVDNEEGPPSGQTILVPAGSAWKYLDDGTDQGTAWRDAEFADGTWAHGPGQLGYGDGDEATVISYGPDLSNKYITSYFRHGFTVTDVSRVQNLSVRVLRDDGVALYLNGVEVLRDNLPAGSLSYVTLAPAAVADENGYFQATIATAALHEGGNVLAAEVHQNNRNSSDLGFDLELSATLLPPQPEIHVLPMGGGGSTPSINLMVTGPAPAGAVIETSTDLVSWTLLQTVDASEVGQPVNCPRSDSEPQRFYRVRVLEPKDE